jgi:Xaa-Pro aminopeptidase
VARRGLRLARNEARAFAGEIKAELEKRGLVSEKLALGSFDGNAREALVNAGVKNLVDGRNLMLEARMIKNEDEIMDYFPRDEILVAPR